MVKLLPVLVLLITINFCSAQVDTTICKMPQFPAQFNGGDSAFFSFIVRNVVYPKACADSAIQGKVYISCLIEKDGRISESTIIKHIHPALEKEAERVIKLLPPFNPAINNGFAVRSLLTIPVVFKVKVAPVKHQEGLMEVVSAVDIAPQFPGGIKTLEKYVDHIFVYPFLCSQLNIQGLCKVKFTVDVTGEVSNVSILKSVHFDLDNEAIRVVKQLPDWNPATIAGKATPCDVILNMNFTLACTSDDLPFSNEDDLRLKYPGGFGAMFNHIFDHIYYSGDVSRFGINGKSIIRFEVDTNGKVKHIEVIKSTFAELEKAVIKAVESLDNFKPGLVGISPQTGRITFPIKYKAVLNSSAQYELSFNRDFDFRRIGLNTEEYSFVDDPPEFEGRPIADISRVLVNHLKLPEGEEKNKDKGPVYVRCFISEEGTIIAPRIYKGVSPALEKEAIRALLQIENISPAYRLSAPIGCEILVPVSFYNF